MRNVKMLKGTALAKRVDPHETSAGGIFIPERDRYVREECTIIETGEVPDAHYGYFPCKGDKVLIERFSGVDMKLDGEDLLVLSAKDIIGVFI